MVGLRIEDKATIAIGSDHNGLERKKELIKFLNGQGYSCSDLGSNGEGTVDYPDFAVKVAKAVSHKEFTYGILVCGTGIGMSIAANKINGVRASLCNSEMSAKMARSHNDANVLCLGSWTNQLSDMEEIALTWLNTAFEGGRHTTRVDKIAQYSLLECMANLEADRMRMTWEEPAIYLATAAYQKIGQAGKERLVINIGGPAGIGKSSLCRYTHKRLGEDNAVIVDLDGWMMKREERTRLGISGMHPNAQYFEEATEALTKFLRGEEIDIPVYDHSKGERGGYKRLRPKRFILIDGTVSFYDPYLQFADIKVFLKTTELSLFLNSIQRDVKERNYTIPQAFEYYSRLIRNYNEFLFPLEHKSDIIFNVDMGHDYRVTKEKG